MFVETCCPKCGKNIAYIRNYSYNIKTFSSCNVCGGFSFVSGSHDFNRIVENKSVITPIPVGIRCLDYKNLINTADFLNRSLKFFRDDVSLLAAAYLNTNILYQGLEGNELKIYKHVFYKDKNDNSTQDCTRFYLYLRGIYRI